MLGVGVVLLALAAGVILRFPSAQRDVQEQSRSSIRDAVLRAAIECYAVEGVYPPSLSYLEQRYGLSINHAVYIVSYDAFASNVLPNVRVLVRGGEGSHE